MKIVNMPIDMIATFTGTRLPVPYKFRYLNDDGDRIEIKIGRITSAEKTKLAGKPVILYTCQSQVHGFVRFFELKYLIDQYRWELYKI